MDTEKLQWMPAGEHTGPESGGEWGRRGTVTVELALVLPLLVILLFGILEFGVLLSVLLQLNNVTREAARAAATGATVAEIETKIEGPTLILDETRVNTTLQYRVRSGGSWTTWTTLVDDGATNSAPTGAQIRIQTQYSHQLIFEALFSRLGGGDGGTISLEGCAIMRRE